MLSHLGCRRRICAVVKCTLTCEWLLRAAWILEKKMQAKNNRSKTVSVFEHLTDLIETTLCLKGDKKVS